MSRNNFLQEQKVGTFNQDLHGCTQFLTYETNHDFELEKGAIRNLI